MVYGRATTREVWKSPCYNLHLHPIHFVYKLNALNILYKGIRLRFIYMVVCRKYYFSTYVFFIFFRPNTSLNVWIRSSCEINLYEFLFWNIYVFLCHFNLYGLYWIFCFCVWLTNILTEIHLLKKKPTFMLYIR